ncbi:MAG: hypothetical protein N2320_00645 [Candidatus Bipolaricaulota bacterium]|nr:hypothetical protein [Candidatus Bipolaricaulota bacterium]
MKKLAFAVALALAVAASAQPVRLLVVDETETVEESLRIQALARALRATEVFAVKAVRALPAEPWAGEPFLFVLLFPARGPYVWLLSPAPVGYLPDPLPLVYAGLVEGVTQAFGGARQVRGSGDDVYAFLLSLHLLRLGVLVGGP